ncbi:WD domain, G-beta repeat containing protein [Trichophyton tonsurans CBS 112818]|uniref:WD domain, G-beta repeat containing protein n=1 Tax=Trichophyton tonsurans (strain CBS 112818) TaxID=647933 RepID=F2S515_TRIT1|nr:WD domain, G-beta repeat containing protein [Trichophyton tonsurans CBS 112818]
MSCSIKNHDTCLPITALKHVNIPGRRLLLNGSGPFVQLLDKSTGTLLDRFRVFERNTVHGIQAVEECWRDDDDYTSSFLVWGGYSLRIVKLHLQGSRETENVSLLAGSGECRTPDWILDTTVPSTSSENKRALKGLLITAHNVVFTLTFLLHETELGDENIIQLHELGSNLRPILYSADITWSSNRVLVAAGTVFGEIIIWSCQLALDSDPCQQADDSIAINHLFTGHEGSIFGVDISPDIPINGGHATKKFVASCSDDRTIRIWDISSYDQGLTSNGELSACETSTNSRGTGFHITPADETSAAQEFCLAKEYGHEARIWGIRFLDFEVSDGSITFNLISRSEDCTSVVWKLTTKYELVNDKYILRRDQTILKPISSYSYHVGKNIWSMDVVENMGSFGVLTGGADSNISSLIVPHTGENIPGRRAKTYTHDRVYDEFLRINNHPAVSDERTKNSRNDGKINSFGFISEDSFIAPFTEGVALLGQVSTAEPQDIRSQDGGVLRWSTIPTIGGIGSYVAIAGIPEREIGLIGTSTGRILWYSHKEGRVEELADISRGISDIFVIQPPKGHDGNDTCPVTFITSSRAFSHANLFIVETSPSPKVLSNQQLALPAEFVVSSALSIPSMSLLILGARWGNIVVFRFSPELQREASEDPLCVFPTHKKDAVTSITFLREDQNSSFVDLITTGRDGTYCIHRLDRSGIQFKMETLHRISPSFGPYIEGSRLDPKTGHLILWGFRSTYFVLWDETTQTEILSVECGGAHRRWAYHFGNMGHVLLWIKASTFNIMSEQFQCHRRVRQGGHGREVKAMSISKMQVDGAKTPWTVLATGAEDTEIRFFTLNEGAEGKDGFRSIRAIKKHSAGLQHLQWSTSGRFLFSSAGREEFYVWRIRWIPGFGIGVLNESEAPKSRANSDLRTTHFDVINITADGGGCESFLIAMAYSNSTAKVFHYLSSVEGGEFTLLAQGVYTSNCLTQIRLVMSGSELQLITGSTDGHIAVWDLTPSIKPYFDLGGRSIKRRDVVPFPAEPVSIKWGDRRPAHQSSIKAMELLPLSGAQVLLITGGDDNCLAFSILRFSEPSTSGPRPSLISRLSTASYPDAHASAINAISQVRRIEHGADKRMVEFLVASSGNDQRIKLWSALADCIDGDVQVSLQGDVYTAVADLSAVDQFTVKASGQDREHLVLCGVGMEMWEVCT